VKGRKIYSVRKERNGMEGRNGTDEGRKIDSVRNGTERNGRNGRRKEGSWGREGRKEGRKDREEGKEGRKDREEGKEGRKEGRGTKE
jgi:hypothetical protein